MVVFVCEHNAPRGHEPALNKSKSGLLSTNAMGLTLPALKQRTQ
jgi:hypothetical protein